MARIVGNRNLTNLQDSNADLDNLAMGSTITNTQNIDVLPPIYEPRYAPQPYRPHEGLYSTMNNQTRFAPDWSDSNYAAKYGYNRPYNMGDVAGEVGEYSQRPAPTINAQEQGSKGFNLSNFFPGKAIYEGIAGMLPKMDPRQKALRDFYGYDNAGRVPTGSSTLMEGYNPVSGGLLNTLTAGKFGEPTNYGLQRAYDKRIGTIDKTLAKWEADEDKYAERLKTTQLYARKKQLQEAKAAEAAMLQKVQTGEGGPFITKKTTAASDQIDQGGGDAGTPGTDAYASRAGSYATYDRPDAQGSPGYHWAQGGRVGYNRGRVVNPGGYAGNLLDIFTEDDLWLLAKHKYDANEVATWKPHGRKDLLKVLRNPNYAQGGLIGYFDGGIAGLL